MPSKLTVAEANAIAEEIAAGHCVPPDRIRRAAVLAFRDANPDVQRMYLSRVRDWTGRRAPDGSDQPAALYWRRLLLEALPAGPPGITRPALIAALPPGGRGPGRMPTISCHRALQRLVAEGTVVCVRGRRNPRVGLAEPDVLYLAGGRA